VPVDEASLERAEDLWVAEFLRGGDGFDYVEALRTCLEELSPEQWRAIDLRYAEKKPRSEMAALCGMTENGIKSLLQRIRRVLGDCVRRKLALETGA
jgi:DNA-directed RNA polymerase specialized sigma24 family protein